MIEFVSDVSIFFNILLSVIGALIVIFGSLQAAWGVLKAEGQHPNSHTKFHRYESVKRLYVQKLIFALDFFIAADLLRLVAEPTLDEIILIALIVVIRTVLNYSLAQEIKETKK